MPSRVLFIYTCKRLSSFTSFIYDKIINMEVAKNIIYLLVGLVVFVTGMNLMSSGLKNVAGSSIRKLFKKIGDNRVVASLIGAGTTALVQSSGATTVMVVGFLSAGALTFTQGFSLMLGAFFGTTITGLFVSLSSFSFSVFLMAVAFIGFIFGFFKDPKLKSVGQILIGFGILFFGLEAMKSTFQISEVQEFLVSFLSNINFPLLLMLFGLVLTALTQSSSATNGIVITMVMANPSLFSSGIYLVIGATIGAMLPTILAAIKGDILSKRVTFTMFISRFLMAVLVTILMWILSSNISNLYTWINDSSVGISLAVFTMVYNLLFIFIMLPLTPLMEKIANKLFIDNAANKKKESIKYLNDTLLKTPSLALVQVKKEIENMYNLAKENTYLGIDALLTLNTSSFKTVEEVEEKIDYLNISISEYLIKLSSNASLDDETIIGAYYHVINDIERIGDHAYNFIESSKTLIEEDLHFSDTSIQEFNEFKNLLVKMFDISLDIFNNGDKDKLATLHELENETDVLTKTLMDKHFNRIKNKECKNELTPFHSTFLSELERIADHLTNIGYSIVNPTGDDIKHII